MIKTDKKIFTAEELTSTKFLIESVTDEDEIPERKMREGISLALTEQYYAFKCGATSVKITKL